MFILTNRWARTLLKEVLIALAFYGIKKIMDKYENERRVTKYGNP